VGNLDPVKDAVEIMRKLKEDGCCLIIRTCREGRRQTDALNWLLENNIPFYRINDHHTETRKTYGYAARKVCAHLYADDRPVGGLADWKDIYKYACRIQNECQRI
jgi:hypothetical protein